MKNANIVAGSRVTANGGKLATVVSVKGRWVRVRFDHDKSEKNVGFADVTPAPEKATRRASTRTPGMVCPKCGSHEVYHGRTVRGIVVDEDSVWGCHACGWDNTSERKNGVVKSEFIGRYKHHKLADGQVVRDNGDDAASMLRGVELDEAFKIVAHKLGVTIKSLHEQYDHLNSGMQRMNLGNRLRKALRDADRATTAAQ